MRIRIPSGMDPNEFSAAVRAVQPNGLIGIPEDDGTGYAVEWDDRVSSPSEKALIEASKAWVRTRKTREAFDECTRRRMEAVAPVASGYDESSRVGELITKTAIGAVKTRREAAGRGRTGETTLLDQLEAIVDQLEAITAARDTILAEIEASPDPGTIDVPNSPHWPS